MDGSSALASKKQHFIPNTAALVIMFRSVFFKRSVFELKSKVFTYCEDENDTNDDDFDFSEFATDAQADAPSSAPVKSTNLKTPMQFENLRNTLTQGSVNTYDGFRIVVQKQVNLNAVVSHL
jgi:hypothetical protein